MSQTNDRREFQDADQRRFGPANGPGASAPTKKAPRLVAAALILAVVGGAAYWWWPQPSSPPLPAPVESPPPAAVAPAPSEAPTTEGIKYPIEPADEASAPRDPESVLVDLFGRRTVLAMFLLDDFPRRFAATIDNLGRASAPASVWPVVPTAGRFQTERRGASEVIAGDNALRYAPFVLLAESVDAGRAVAAYRRLYPLFQRAYEELGFPGRYFNDRVVEVIDLLLATPTLDAPPVVRLPSIQGPMQPERPWVTYRFDDPALESLAAGQRILLRVGPANASRLKARLTEIRRLLVDAKAGR